MRKQPKNGARGGFARGVALLVAGCAGFVAPAQGAANDPARLFQKFCYECHGEGAHKGKIDLEEMLTPANLKKQQREWERAWKIVRHEFMPPVDAEQPTAAE